MSEDGVGECESECAHPSTGVYLSALLARMCVCVHVFVCVRVRVRSRARMCVCVCASPQPPHSTARQAALTHRTRGVCMCVCTRVRAMWCECCVVIAPDLGMVAGGILPHAKPPNRRQQGRAGDARE